MHFVVAGKICCPQFSYAAMVAQRLEESLPGFTYLKLPMKEDEWEKWLIRTCKENEWYHTKSPLIWREIGLKKGKKEFIGDINKFLDLCYDYYGIPREVLSAESFNKEEMDWFKNRTESEFFENIRQEARKRTQYRSRQVCITGAGSQKTEIIIMELLQMESQKREDGLEIRLFDDPSKEKKLVSSANDGNYCPGPSGFGNCRVVTTLKDALTNIDMVIILDTFARKPRETLVKWLKRNRNAMAAFGKALNMYAPSHCRVIIGSPSSQPTCYNATVLAKFATKLHVRNIVVVTQDLGREILKPLSTKLNVPLKDFFCPPVWGFVGLNKFIDVSRTLQTHLYKVPGKRPNSSIPQGSEEYELRTSECLISEEETGDLHVSVADHKAESFPQLGRWPCLAKATAIIDLLKVWGLKQEDGNGEILCLGVYSDGTFNIPQGIYWSQPVILKNGFWVPFEDFPVPRFGHFNCYSLFLYSIAALYRTKIKPRIYVQPNPTTKRAEKKKFDFDKLVESVGMPVIRNDNECLNYLKYLAKVELGIDFDAVDQTIEEETEPEIEPPEEVRKEDIFCECWRQELKQWQRIVFDRSSTTEVEVDLSENVSGSEWSVINVHPKTSSSSGTEERIPKSEKPSSTTSSTSMVCSCGARSSGSICRCFEQPPKKQPEEEEVSTEHFYKEQNAEVFNEDLQDPIYADAYIEERHVAYDADAKQGDEKPPYGFYGKKDAIRDVEADFGRMKRIRRYERGGEESVEEEEPETVATLSSSEKGENSLKGAKFHIHIEGVSYDIIGDQDVLERLEETQIEAVKKDSSNSFREMYTDEATPGLAVLPPQVTDTESSLRDVSYAGEGKVISYQNIPEMTGERSSERISITTLEEALDEVWGEDLFVEEGKEKREEGSRASEAKSLKEEKKRRIRREGIPLCCMCRCIVPEGLPCCPCGTTTVVEVFKKESVDVFIQNEDELTFRIEYFETPIPQESVSSESVPIEPPPEETVIRKDLPPESFFPFSPKLENKFADSVRPEELTPKNVDLSQKDISEKCAELLNLARQQIQEESEENWDGESKSQSKMSVFKEEEEEEEQEQEEDGKIKTDFSDLHLFIPDGIEDWRLTVQKKYREWFFEETKIRDESYYDVAIEEVSEDEFEVDKELEQYFET